MPPKQTKPKTEAPAATTAAPAEQKTKKEIKSKAETAPAATPAADATPAKKETKPRAKKEPAPVEQKTEATSAPDATDEAEVSDISTQTAEFQAKLSQIMSLFTALKTEFRGLEKKWGREMKAAQKTQAKRKRQTGNRQPSGFTKPTRISDELAKFINKPVGTEMARTEVTREINKYIREHSLQDPENGRKINPDSKLQTLLKLTKSDELTYFNLQRYMSPHFTKAEKPAATA